MNNENIHIKLPEEVKRALQRKAESNGQNMSTYLRQLIIATIKEK